MAPSVYSATKACPPCISSEYRSSRGAVTKTNLMVCCELLHFVIDVLRFAFGTHDDSILVAMSEAILLPKKVAEPSPIQSVSVPLKYITLEKPGLLLDCVEKRQRRTNVHAIEDTNFTIFCRSAPEKPAVPRAIIMGSTSRSLIRQFSTSEGITIPVAEIMFSM